MPDKTFFGWMEKYKRFNNIWLKINLIYTSLKKNQRIHGQELEYTVKATVRQKVELNVICFSHYKALLSKSDKKKFWKISKNHQNFTIFESFRFFFRSFLRLINSYDGSIAPQKLQKNNLNCFCYVQFKEHWKKAKINS